MNLHFLTREVALSKVSIRSGETKLGEALTYCDHLEALRQLPAKYVLIGIPEDLGVRANYGVAGASSAYSDFLNYILNVQSNAFFDPKDLVILGDVALEDLVEKGHTADIPMLRAHTQEVDERVAEVITAIVSAQKIPIIIGGGHNNSYGIIKGVSNALHHPIHTLNIDPHSDFRAMEGRHSGNGFRYAFEEGYLDRYAIFGLHESYNNQSCLEALDSFPNRILYHTFENMLIRELLSVKEVLTMQTAFLDHRYGLEIDMDSIAGMPSSAYTPSGFSTTQIRQILHELSKSTVHYLHLAEAAPSAMIDRKVGKMLAYLVMDFVKGQ
jgi:formiminoglutamase